MIGLSLNKEPTLDTKLIRLTFYKNDKTYKYNNDVWYVNKKISNDYKELDSYTISKKYMIL